MSICCLKFWRMLGFIPALVALESVPSCAWLTFAYFCWDLSLPTKGTLRGTWNPLAGYTSVYLHHFKNFDFLKPPPFTLRKPQRSFHRPRRKMTRSPSVSTGWEAHRVELHVLTAGNCWHVICPDYIMRMACNM